MIVPPLCTCGTAYLIPKKVPPEQQANRFIKAFDGRSGNWSALATRSRIIDDTVKSRETVYGEFHERLGVGRTCNVCTEECDPLAEFFFKGLTFFGQEIAENHFGTFFDETSDDALADASGTACNDSNLIFQSESG
jgi:hypothetical protein